MCFIFLNKRMEAEYCEYWRDLTRDRMKIIRFKMDAPRQRTVDFMKKKTSTYRGVNWIGTTI